MQGLPEWFALIVGVVLSKHGKRLTVIDSVGSVYVYVRRRPEYWCGVAWLPEFWLTMVLGVGLVVSVVRDQRTLKKAA